MRHLETFRNFREYIYAIQPENKPEENIRIAFLNYLGSDDDDEQYWSTPEHLISQLQADCYDEHFDTEVDQYPFTEDDLHSFMIKYDIHG